MQATQPPRPEWWDSGYEHDLSLPPDGHRQPTTDSGRRYWERVAKVAAEIEEHCRQGRPDPADPDGQPVERIAARLPGKARLGAVRRPFSDTMNAMEQSVAVVTEASLRARAIDVARASCRLDGLEPDQAAVAVTERYVAGELTGEQLVEEMIRLPVS